MKLNLAKIFRKRQSTLKFKNLILPRTQTTKINAVVKTKRKKSNLINQLKHSSVEVILKHPLQQQQITTNKSR